MLLLLMIQIKVILQTKYLVDPRRGGDCRESAVPAAAAVVAKVRPLAIDGHANQNFSARRRMYYYEAREYKTFVVAIHD